MSLLGPFAVGQTVRLGNHANSTRDAITDADGAPTTPATCTLVVTKPDPANPLPGFRTSVTYSLGLGTLQVESAGRLYVDVVPASGEDGRWGCAMAATTPTTADTWELVVEANPT